VRGRHRRCRCRCCAHGTARQPCAQRRSAVGPIHPPSCRSADMQKAVQAKAQLVQQSNENELVMEVGPGEAVQRHRGRGQR
jgi:hypothetical protein